jgi:hypothetical protein
MESNQRSQETEWPVVARWVRARLAGTCTFIIRYEREEDAEESRLVKHV